MSAFSTILLTLVTTMLINNVVLSQFMGLCPFLGVSKQIKTALGMGAAVIFVITASSAVTAVLYRYVLLRYDLTYLNTIVFIVVIAALVQFVEMILRKFSPALYRALGVYLPLITTESRTDHCYCDSLRAGCRGRYCCGNIPWCVRKAAIGSVR